MRTGGRVLIDGLIARGTDTVFCVPGESFLGALDASMTRRSRPPGQLPAGGRRGQYGRGLRQAHRKAGHLLRTRGPGATNASIGLHTARQDSTPMILFIGQVGRDMLGREAFQEIDYRRMFGEVTKWVDQIDDPARIPEYLARGWNIAMSGRKGPVALVLPEDILTEEVDTADLARRSWRSRRPRLRRWPSSGSGLPRRRGRW
jgi:acetolactate synthase-1/2/3 large subunit